jgi:hypothetical protein
MAIIRRPESNGLSIDELCPEGMHVAVIGRIDDQFGVERRTFDDPNQTELRDVTKFLFGVLTSQGPFRVATYEMKISFWPNAKLYGFLASLLGQEPPDGWDYMSLEGHGAVIKVEHRTTRVSNRTYAVVTEVRPVRDQLSDHSAQVPDPTLFVWQDATNAQPPAPNPVPPPSPHSASPSPSGAASVPAPAPQAAPAHPSATSPMGGGPTSPASASSPQPAANSPQGTPFPFVQSPATPAGPPASPTNAVGGGPTSPAPQSPSSHSQQPQERSRNLPDFADDIPY